MLEAKGKFQSSDTIKSQDRVLVLLFFAMYLCFFVFQSNLYLKVLIQYPGKLGNYVSDIPNHVVFSCEYPGYSIMSILMRFIYMDLPVDMRVKHMILSSLLAAIDVGCIIFTDILLRSVFSNINKWLIKLVSFVGLFIMPIYLPFANSNHYLGMIAPNVWHNDTYSAMRCFAAIALLWVFKKLNDSKFDAAYLIKLFVIFSIVNLMKPNFILAFIPAFGIYILAEIIRKKIKLKDAVLFSLPVILSCSVLLWQYGVVYGTQTNTTTETSRGIGISFAYCLRYYSSHPIVAVLQSLTFPAIVIWSNRNKIARSKPIILCLISFVVALIESLFLVETNRYSVHGNWDWGQAYFTYILFDICILLFSVNIREYLSNKTGTFAKYINRTRKEFLFLLIQCLLLIGHIVSGIWYYIIISLGGSYN